MSAARQLQAERAPAFELVGFEPWHLAHIEARVHDRLELAQIGDPVERGAAYADAGPAFTSALIETLPVSFHRLVLRMLDQQQRRHRCRRLQASVRQDHRVSIRWLHRLGFTYEGRMEAYGADGSPYLRFARFCDDSPVMLRRPDAIGDGQAIDGI